ncbi:MAG: glycosyltransferase [Clostridia bacterium]|nr:glycosyltransferase [Clostridia bacterium]
MKRIAVFQSDLNVGGIQKALVNILNEIDYSACEVDLYLFDRDCFFDLPEHKNLNVIFKKPWPFLNRMVYFDILSFLVRPVTKKEYDVAVDFNSYRNECSVGAVLVKAKKRVMWIHNDVEIKRRNEWKYKVLWHFFRRKFRFFDEFAAVSPGIIDGFRRCSGIYDKKITAIPNRIDTAEIFMKAEAPVDFDADPACYNLCTMGRLCHQKGFDILIGYMAEVAKRRPDMRLYVFGDGPDRAKLQRQIDDLGLSGVVTLMGNKANPFPYLDKMDGFVLTSRYEGQGLVIWEAKTLGLEIFITENLVKYNPDVEGYTDIVEALCAAGRKEKIRDDLSEYNRNIGDRLKKVLEV